MLSSNSKESKFVPFDDLRKYFIYKVLFDFRVNETSHLLQVRDYEGIGKYHGVHVYTFVNSTLKHSSEIQRSLSCCVRDFTEFVYAFIPKQDDGF